MGKRDSLQQKKLDVVIPDNDQVAVETVSFDQHPEESAEKEVVEKNGDGTARVRLICLIDRGE